MLIIGQCVINVEMRFYHYKGGIVIGKCSKCGADSIRYGLPSVMDRACDFCGSFIFWCLHAGFRNGMHDPSEDRWVLVDLSKNEIVGEEMKPGDAFDDVIWKARNGNS